MTDLENLKEFDSTSGEIPYILESNAHPSYSFRGLKNLMRIRIACGLDLQLRAGFWKNDRAAVHAVRTIQFILFIIYNIYIIYHNLFFIRLTVITQLNRYLSPSHYYLYLSRRPPTECHLRICPKRCLCNTS